MSDNKILVGSRYFFSRYEDFNSKDTDYVELIPSSEFRYIRQITGNGKCIFQINKRQSKADHIAYALKSSTGMVLGKFLVPEFCELLDFTMKDLKKLAPLVDRLDEKHMYEKIIYESYIKNNSFTLSEELRLLAYASYKKSRGIK